MSWVSGDCGIVLSSERLRFFSPSEFAADSGSRIERLQDLLVAVLVGRSCVLVYRYSYVSSTSL